MKPVVVIITGPPGAGKTTLARAIAGYLGLPLLVKDDIKDAAFDTLGWSDRKWSQQIGGLSFAVLYRLLRAQLEIGQSVVVETAFNPQMDGAKFDEIKAQFPFKAIQIVVTADGDTLFLDSANERPVLIGTQATQIWTWTVRLI